MSEPNPTIDDPNPSQPQTNGQTAPPTPSHTLLWSKSKVYVHPSPYTKHNVPGYLALVRQGPLRPRATILLSFLPESLVEQRQELEKFVRIEYTASAGSSLDTVEVEEEDESELIAEPPASSAYAFSLPLSSIYSFTIKPPTISCWYGTITLSQIGGVAMPTLHFHDDESKSTILSMHRAKTTGPPGYPSSSNDNSARPSTGGANRSPSPLATWGGDELLQQLRKYSAVHRSVIDSSLFLINPTRADLETHNTPIFDDDAVETPAAGSSGYTEFPDDPFNPTYPMSNRPSRNSALHQSLAGGSHSPRKNDASMDNLTLWAKSTRLSVLSSFANLTQQARHASHAVLSHPLAKPYVPHLPQPVQSFAQAGPIPLGPNEGEWEWRKSNIANASGTGEYYDSARVYLAKWARLVAEEGERNRLREERLGIASDGPAAAAADEDGVEGGELGAFEVLEKVYDFPRPSSERQARLQELQAAAPPDAEVSAAMDLSEWTSLFDAETGRPLHPSHELRHRVFVNGLTDEARKEAWPFLLDAVPFQSSSDERAALWRKRQEEYHAFKARWQANEAYYNSDSVKEQRHRIRVDCLRTDRGQPMFASEKQADEQLDNPHVGKLGEILLTYGVWEAEESGSEDQEHGLAGYVQGMSDLCSPIYVICDGDEVRTFWCFVGFMDRVKSNFYRDQSGMKSQLLLLQKLIAIMDPKLYAHLERTDSLNLFFCFRWLLVCFKREFGFGETLRIWECCWAAEGSGDGGWGLTPHMALFVALAILEIHRDVLIRYLENFDEILQYLNGLSQGQLDVEAVLARAEVLCRGFQEIVQRVLADADGGKEQGALAKMVRELSETKLVAR